MQHVYDSFRRNLRQVARDDSEECPCRGYGWISSPFDTWHQCPVHFRNQRHPESPEYARADVVEVFKVVDNEMVPVFQVEMTVGHDGLGEDETYLHFHEFDSEEDARQFGERIAQRADISSRVQNKQYWLHLTRPPRPEDLL